MHGGYNMAFSVVVVDSLFRMGGGVCKDCKTPLVWNNRGGTGAGAWEAHHIDGDPNNKALVNCKILCWPCHEKTL